MLLEDSKLDAEILEAQLEGAPFAIVRVETRASFEAALRSARFAAVLSDYNLPGFSGHDALRLAQELMPGTPFLFVSGALGEHTAVELLKLGATDYVLKDQLERLLPSLERALREAAQRAEHERAEQALREREQSLSTLMSNLPGLAFRRELEPPFRILFASQGCGELTGYEPDALRAEPGGWAALIHPDDLASFTAAAGKAYQTGEQLTHSYRIRTTAGALRWVWERSLRTAVEGGAIVEGFAADQTQQKAAEDEVARRVEFEQQLIGIVSHDLRTPLNTITLGAALLLRQEGLNPAGTRSVRRILNAAERAVRMIRDLLDFTAARLGGYIPMEARPVDVGALVLQVVEEFEHSHATRTIEVAIGAPTHAEWDPDRITQALTNLIGNALSYSTPDSPIAVRVSIDGSHALLEVHNLGEPIAEHRMPQLFTPLSRRGRVDVQTRSIGLGLFIVQNIVVAHRGEMRVRSTAGEGTTFTMRIPLHPRGAAQ
ncbi:MAG TPA: ATP-binding protein [Polyangiales bacterium]|nr:ATP-binding protein [Polyangiales bacterium]